MEEVKKNYSDSEAFIVGGEGEQSSKASSESRPKNTDRESEGNQRSGGYRSFDNNRRSSGGGYRSSGDRRSSGGYRSDRGERSEGYRSDRPRFENSADYSAERAEQRPEGSEGNNGSRANRGERAERFQGGYRAQRSDGYRSERSGGYRSDRGGDRPGGFRSERPVRSEGSEGAEGFKAEGSERPEGFRSERSGGYRSDRGGSGGYRSDRSGSGGYRSDRGGSGGYRSDRTARSEGSEGFKSDRSARPERSGGYRSDRGGSNGYRSDRGGDRRSSGGYRSEGGGGFRKRNENSGSSEGDSSAGGGDRGGYSRGRFGNDRRKYSEDRIVRRNPRTPGSRFQSFLKNDNISEDYTPEKRLMSGNIRRSAGRNCYGRITVRHRGGGADKKYRIIDFKREERTHAGTVESIQYDPNRNVPIALLVFPNGARTYILLPEGVVVGAVVSAGEAVEASLGNALPLKNIPVGFTVHNVELEPGKGGVLVRSAGASAQILAKENGYVTLKMPSDETRLINEECWATVGSLANAAQKNVSIGKAGRNRHRGFRPSVRGMAMNPVDHPRGGGEGKSKSGSRPVSPWGKCSGGTKTRRRTSRFIIKRSNDHK